MLLLKDGSYAKVWSVEIGEKSSTAQISISKKATDKSFPQAVVNGYEFGWKGFVKMVGAAHMMAKTLDCSNGAVTIKIGEWGESGGWPITDKDGKKGTKPYQRVILSFELADNAGNVDNERKNKQTAKKPQKQSYNNLPDGDEELPF